MLIFFTLFVSHTEHSEEWSPLYDFVNCVFSFYTLVQQHSIFSSTVIPLAITLFFGCWLVFLCWFSGPVWAAIYYVAQDGWPPPLVGHLVSGAWLSHDSQHCYSKDSFELKLTFNSPMNSFSEILINQSSVESEILALD